MTKHRSSLGLGIRPWLCTRWVVPSFACWKRAPVEEDARWEMQKGTWENHRLNTGMMIDTYTMTITLGLYVLQVKHRHRRNVYIQSSPNGRNLVLSSHSWTIKSVVSAPQPFVQRSQTGSHRSHHVLGSGRPSKHAAAGEVGGTQGDGGEALRARHVVKNVKNPCLKFRHEKDLNLGPDTLPVFV